MKRAAVLAFFALAACGPKTETAAPAPPAPAAGLAPSPAPAPQPAAEAGCAAQSHGEWKAKGQAFKVEARTQGPTCATAVALLVLRGSAGDPAFTWSGSVKDLFGLADAKDAAAMKSALADWIDQKNSSISSTADLPVWDKTAGQSKAEEFPFHPEDGVERKAWDELRKAKLSTFCFPQGMESLACVVERQGEIQALGLQQFPG